MYLESLTTDSVPNKDEKMVYLKAMKHASPEMDKKTYHPYHPKWS